MAALLSVVKKDDAILRVLPQFFPKHWLDKPGIVSTDFPSRIRIGYVLRDAAVYSYIVEHQLPELALSVEELHSIALANLARLPSASITIGKVPGGWEGWISAKEDNFAAVRVLLPSAQQEFTRAALSKRGAHEKQIPISSRTSARWRGARSSKRLPTQRRVKTSISFTNSPSSKPWRAAQTSSQ